MKRFLNFRVFVLCGALLAIAGTQIAIARLNSVEQRKIAESKQLDVTRLPLELGNGWVGVETEFDERLFSKLGAYGMVNRLYTNESGQQVAIHISAFTHEGLRTQHTPQDCYPRAGWKITRDKWRNGAGGFRHPQMMIERENTNERAALAYWFQLGPQMAANRNGLRKAYQRLRKKNGPMPPLVKVLVQVPYTPTSAADTGKVIDDLGKQIFQWINQQSRTRPEK